MESLECTRVERIGSFIRLLTRMPPDGPADDQPAWRMEPTVTYMSGLRLDRIGRKLKCFSLNRLMQR